MVYKIIICFLAGYLFGNILTGEIVSKIKNVDLRKHGSGNVGTTNSIRVFGKKIGYLIFAGDYMKAFIPVIIVKYLIFKGDPWAGVLALVTGLGAIIGHDYPVFFKFKGGKGVATMIGAICGFDIRYFLIILVVFCAVFFATKYVSVGSLTVAVTIPVFMLILHWGEWWEFGITIVYCLLTFFSHRTNIKRLLNGTENSFRKKKE